MNHSIPQGRPQHQPHQHLATSHHQHPTIPHITTPTTITSQMSHPLAPNHQPLTANHQLAETTSPKSRRRSLSLHQPQSTFPARLLTSQAPHQNALSQTLRHHLRVRVLSHRLSNGNHRKPHQLIEAISFLRQTLFCPISLHNLPQDSRCRRRHRSCVNSQSFVQHILLHRQLQLQLPQQTLL